MITSLAIRNFKCFLSLDLEFLPLTVLTGINGAGKSTVIQAMLLARQAIENPSDKVVQLNGPYGLSLGEALDVLHPEATRPSIEISVGEQEARHTFIFDVPEDRRLNLPIQQRPELPHQVLAGEGMSFSYLTAERLGPRDQLEVTAAEAGQVGIGTHGEYTAQALALHETAKVRTELLHPDTRVHGVTTLRTQVEMWASSIIRPIRIISLWPAGITASLIRFQDPSLISEQVRPTNIGFGVSYALPIIVAALLLPPDGLLLVENPEAHLHPAGQSRLGQFLGRVAGSGAQIVVETHSDHVLNGLRLASVEEGVVDPDNVIVYFFGGDRRGGPTPIRLTERAGLTSWPKGFFDQMEADLGRLARAKRRQG